jgi:DNA repair protein RadC
MQLHFDNITTPQGYEIKFKLATFTVHDSGNATGKKWHTGQPVRNADDLWNFAKGIYATMDADKEHFVLLAFNNKNRVIGYKLISTGSLTASLVHPREVWRAGLFFDAAAVAFIHNHPSGDPAPSAEDIDITKRLKDVGDIIGIRVLDHVILGEDRFFSFNNRGML